MPVFSYVAKDQSDATRKGTLQGDSAVEVRQQLREMGLRIVAIREKASKKHWLDFSHWRKVSAADVATITGDLATLLSVGVPMLKSMETLESQYQGNSQTVIQHLKDQVSSGKPLATAMKDQPQVFDNLCLKMVEVGESTGELDVVLRQLAEFKRRSSQFKDQVLTALLYPLIVLVVSMLVTIFLMIFVVPNLLDNLVAANKPLPLPTMILKFGSDLLLAHGWWIGVLVLGGVVLLGVFVRTDSGARIWHRIVMKIPVVGTLSRKQEIARVALIISTLIKSGVEFLEAIEIAKGTASNPILRDSLELCAENVRSGKEIGPALEASQFFSPVVVQVFTIGQSSGQLEEMLARLADDYDQEVESVAARLSTTIEPVLILILSVFVGFILFATLLPILETSDVL